MRKITHAPGLHKNFSSFRSEAWGPCRDLMEIGFYFKLISIQDRGPGIEEREEEKTTKKPKLTQPGLGRLDRSRYYLHCLYGMEYRKNILEWTMVMP